MTKTSRTDFNPRLGDCLVGANPIIWSNDDFNDLAGDVPLDTILAEMRAAGYSGSELGHAYPRAPAALASASTGRAVASNSPRSLSASAPTSSSVPS